MKDLTANQLQAISNRLGYVWFDDRPNLIGIRATNYRSDEFCDWMYVVWKQPRLVTLSVQMTSVMPKQQILNKWLYTGRDGKPLKEDGVQGENTTHALNWYESTKDGWRMICYKQTTNSGRWGLINPQNAKGTAVLKPMQHLNAYALGFHKGSPEHPALVQSKPVTVWRDADRDTTPEKGQEDTGLFGINIHRANQSGSTSNIGKWSVGCQVAQSVDDHLRMIQICRNFRERGITQFSYTLLTEDQLTTS